MIGNGKSQQAAARRQLSAPATAEPAIGKQQQSSGQVLLLLGDTWSGKSSRAAVKPLCSSQLAARPAVGKQAIAWPGSQAAAAGQQRPGSSSRATAVGQQLSASLAAHQACSSTLQTFRNATQHSSAPVALTSPSILTLLLQLQQVQYGWSSKKVWDPNLDINSCDASAAL